LRKTLIICGFGLTWNRIRYIVVYRSVDGLIDEYEHIGTYMIIVIDHEHDIT